MQSAYAWDVDELHRRRSLCCELQRSRSSGMACERNFNMFRKVCIKAATITHLGIIRYARCEQEWPICSQKRQWSLTHEFLWLFYRAIWEMHWKHHKESVRQSKDGWCCSNSIFFAFIRCDCCAMWNFVIRPSYMQLKCRQFLPNTLKRRKKNDNKILHAEEQSQNAKLSRLPFAFLLWMNMKRKSDNCTHIQRTLHSNTANDPHFFPINFNKYYHNSYIEAKFSKTIPIHKAFVVCSFRAFSVFGCFTLDHKDIYFRSRFVCSHEIYSPYTTVILETALRLMTIDRNDVSHIGRQVKFCL